MVFNFFQRFLKSQIPSVKADEPEEDLVDPLDTVREKCREDNHAKHFADVLDECTNRVNSKKQTTETCAQELYDWVHAVDHCVSNQLFPHLK